MLLPVLAAQAQVPGTVAYQGYLVDAQGTPLGGSVNLAFRLYDAPAGGTAVWAESQLGVPVTEGVFAVHLGMVEPLDGVAFDGPLWLAVQVNGGDELAPRVALSAAPYALSTRGLRLLPAGDQDNGPSIVLGEASNTVEVLSEGRLSPEATIGGGRGNRAGRGATVGGGRENAALDCYDTVGGGIENRAQGINHGGKAGGLTCGATVGGGNGNVAAGEVATVAGGTGNVARGSGATVGGGFSNLASGRQSTVPGGGFSQARGAYSFAAGHYARAAHAGTFVWSDDSQRPADSLVTTGEHQFLIRARGGVGIGTNAPAGALHVVNEDDQALDLVLGGSGEDNLFGDIGVLASDPNLPSSDLLFVSNDAVAVLLNSDGSNESSHFSIARNLLTVPAFEVDLDGEVATGQLRLRNELGAGGEPEEGGVYRDNLVYAWAHVNADGSVAASFGCEVTRQGEGRYAVSFGQSLPGGVAPMVTPRSDAPVLASVLTTGANAQALVYLFALDPVTGQFARADNGFYIQVVGRP